MITGGATFAMYKRYSETGKVCLLAGATLLPLCLPRHRRARSTFLRVVPVT